MTQPANTNGSARGGQNPNADALYAAMAALQTADDVKDFLRDLCTPQELQAFVERFWIARLLSEGGKSYRDISALTGASTTTVTRVARFLNDEPHGGYRRVLGDAS